MKTIIADVAYRYVIKKNMKQICKKSFQESSYSSVSFFGFSNVNYYTYINKSMLKNVAKIVSIKLLKTLLINYK